MNVIVMKRKIVILSGVYDSPIKNISNNENLMANHGRSEGSLLGFAFYNGRKSLIPHTEE